MALAVVRRGRSSGLSLPSLRAMTAAGVAFYALAAGLDGFMTLSGLGHDAKLEGNGFLRAADGQRWDRARPVAGQALGRAALWFVAARIGRAIHDDEAWIEKIPTLPALRRWLRAGDHCWIALIPLYAVAAAQLFGASAWIWLKLSGGF